MRYMLTHYIDESLELSPEDEVAFDVALEAWDNEMLERGVGRSGDGPPSDYA